MPQDAWKCSRFVERVETIVNDFHLVVVVEDLSWTQLNDEENKSQRILKNESARIKDVKDMVVGEKVDCILD